MYIVHVYECMYVFPMLMGMGIFTLFSNIYCNRSPDSPIPYSIKRIQVDFPVIFVESSENQLARSPTKSFF